MDVMGGTSYIEEGGGVLQLNELGGRYWLCKTQRSAQPRGGKRKGGHIPPVGSHIAKTLTCNTISV